MKRLIALSLFAFLACKNVSANEWSPHTNIEDIIVGYQGEQIMFTTTAPVHNPSNNCNPQWYTVSPEYASAEHILSVLLTAQSRGSLIRIGVDTSNCGPLGNYVRVLKVRISK